jgi:hypothetical protein
MSKEAIVKEHWQFTREQTVPKVPPSYKDGYRRKVTVVEGDIELTLDIPAIMKRMGEKAAFNSTGMSREMSGLIVARARNRKKTVAYKD